MANGSEYRLNLKAVLDTSQVQQELDKLKRAQQAEHGGGGSPAAGGEKFAGNFSRLDQTLQRLNQSVQRLQRSVDQLGRGFKQAQQAAPAPGGRGGPGLPVIPGKWVQGRSESSVTQNWLKSKEYARLNRDWTRHVRRDIAAGKIPADLFSEDGFGTRAFYDNVFKREDVLPEADRQDYLRKRRAFNERVNNSPAAKARLAQMRQNRRLAGLIAGQLVGGAADIATDFGLTKTGTVLGAVGSGINAGFGSALAVSMMGGGNPVSIGVGAVVGLATAASQAVAGLEKLAQAAADAAEAQRKRGESLIRSGAELQRARSAASQEWQASVALEEKDKGKA